MLGLYDYNARWYDPGTGRFVSADTVVPDEGDPQAWNRLAYVRNNPVARIDPTGHADENPCFTIDPEQFQASYSQILAAMENGDRFLVLSDSVLFDLNHARKNWEIAQEIYSRWEDGYFTLTFGTFSLNYEVDAALSGAALDAAAFSVWKDFVTAKEMSQNSATRFSYEDMCSNYAGFMAWVVGSRSTAQNGTSNGGSDRNADIANILAGFHAYQIGTGNLQLNSVESFNSNLMAVSYGVFALKGASLHPTRLAPGPTGGHYRVGTVLWQPGLWPPAYTQLGWRKL